MEAKIPPAVAAIEYRVTDWVRQPDKTRRLFPWLLLALTLLVWFPTLFYGLDLSNADDYYHITDTALHHSPKDIAGWFTRGYWAYHHYEYRPLTRLSLLLTYFVWGPRPFGFHLANVLLHFLCAFLLGAVMVNAGAPKWAARLSSAIWVVFPQAFMAVRWINGRQDLQCAALVLAGLWFFSHWLQGKPFRHLAGAALCVVLAALTKEPGAFALLFLLAAAFLFPGRRPWRGKLAGVFATALPLIPYLFLRLRVWSVGSYGALYTSQSKPLDLTLQGPLLGDLLAPALYPLFNTWPNLGIYLLFATNRNELVLQQAAFWGGLAILLRWQPRLLLTGLAWKIIFFLPVYNLYWHPIYTHYRYLPTMGTALLAGAAAWELGVWFCARVRRWLRPAMRWSIVAISFALLLGFYWAQIPFTWPTWSVIAKGGIPPPPEFGRKLVHTRAVGFTWTIMERPRPVSPP